MNGLQVNQKLESAPNANQNSGILKKCINCQEIKLIDDFNIDRKSKDEHRAKCKKCNNERARQLRNANLEKAREKSRRWAKTNPSKIREMSLKWRTTNPERSRELNRKAKAKKRIILILLICLLYSKASVDNYKKNIFALRCKRKSEKSKIWYKNNLDKVREYGLKWKKENPDRRRLINQKADKKRMSTPKGKLSRNISVAIRETLRKDRRGWNWEDLVGYTVDQLKRHIEKKFKPGMTWGKFMKGEIHIDHKIPKSVFNYEKPEDDDFKRCWALKNLQPLWAFDNISKHDRLDKPFQPSLIFK